MNRTLLAILALGLAGPGCMKKSSAESSYAGSDMAMESEAYGGGYDGADFDDDSADYGDMEESMDMAAEMEPAAAPMPSDSGGRMGGLRERRAAKKSMSKDRGLAPGGSSPPPEPEPADTKPADTESTKAKPGTSANDSKDEPEAIARQIIYTAQMRLAVFNVDEAMERVEALAVSVDGYVQQMRQGYFILRIPAAHLRGVMDSVGGLGMVTERNLEARDVTEEYVDVTTRIRVLRETQGQLIALLKRTKTVEEALHVRQALDQVTMQLEQALGRLRVLESLIGFSTLTVYIDERGPQNDIPSSNDPFPWVDSLGVEATEWN